MSKLKNASLVALLCAGVTLSGCIFVNASGKYPDKEKKITCAASNNHTAHSDSCEK